MQTSSRLSPLSGATGSASPGVPRRRGWRLLAHTSMTRPYSFWPRRDPDLAGPRPASWRALQLGGAHNLDLGEGCGYSIVLD